LSKEKLGRRIATVLTAGLSVVTLCLTGAACHLEAPLPVTLASVSPSELGGTVVPDLALDLYIYVKQESPTLLPASVLNLPFPVTVEMASLWGVAERGGFTFGGGLLFPDPDSAARAEVELGLPGLWIQRDGAVLYFVEGSSEAAQTLQAAIMERRFKYYDNTSALRVVAALPRDGPARLGAVLVSRPQIELNRYVDRATNLGEWRLENMPFKLARISTVVAGLYADRGLDIEALHSALQAGDLFHSDFNTVMAAASSLPGFLVDPFMSQLLAGSGLKAVQQGDVKYYLASHATSQGELVHAAVRSEGNCLFAALSRNEADAEALVLKILPP
jgi:hypothetical protein